MKPLLLWMILAQGADATTTVIGLNRGCQEAVLPTQSPAGIVGIKSGVVVGFTWTLGKVGAQPKARTAMKVAAAALAVSGTFGAVWNARQLPKCRK